MEKMKGRKWKNINSEKAEKIKVLLIENGGEEQDVKSPHEKWRIRFSDSTFIYYKKGTLYSTPSTSGNPIVIKKWQEIDSIIGFQYAPPTKDFLIGLDETGRGECIGHVILTGVMFPKEIFRKIDYCIGPVDTKRRHKFKYWDQIFRQLNLLREEGLTFISEKIPPWHIDKYNLNKIMDITYQKILSIFLRKIEIARCRIVLDDYGIGLKLKCFFNFLKQKGAKVIVTTNSEDIYLETKTASLISKREREAVIKAINENPKYQIDELSIGSGNAGVPGVSAI